MTHTPGKNVRYLSLCLHVEDLPCLVVGGGTVACRKAETLVEAGARVTIVAPSIEREVVGAVWEKRAFRDEDIATALIVVAATDDRALNAHIAETARQNRRLINVADDPRRGNLLFPAVFRRGQVAVAVSTGGACPALAQQLRSRLEKEIGPEMEEVANLLGSLRDEWEPLAIAAGIPPSLRGKAWHAVAALPLAELSRAGKLEEAESLARRVLESFMSYQPRRCDPAPPCPDVPEHGRTAGR